jgi:serine/threonine protein kinase
VEYFIRSSKQGNSDAQLNLGFCLHKGVGINRNFLESVKCFKAAADRCHPVGQFNYGLCCYRGEGTSIDFGEAAEYFKLAADQNYLPALNAYSVCLAAGHGVPRDFPRSLIYLYRSCRCDWKEVRFVEKLVSVSSLEIRTVISRHILFSSHLDGIQRNDLFTPDPASLYVRRPRSKRVTLHPDVVDEEHLSEFKIDVSQLRFAGQIGQGASSHVVLMVNERSEEVAVKWCSLDSRTHLAFSRELGALCLLNHPCIVPLYGFSVTVERVLARKAALVMKHMVNGSLRNVLDKAKAGNPPWFWNGTGIAIIICGIVVGLEFIHSQGHVHRDIKPANLLLDKRGHCRIGDLGSSRFLEADAHLSSAMSITPLYQAPELWLENKYTNKVDVFSFGLVLYEMLVGEMGNSTNNPHQIAEGARAPLPDGMKKEVKELISKCWAQSPDDRPSFAQVLEELERMDFQVVPDIDGGSVREFLADLRRRERNKMHVSDWVRRNGMFRVFQSVGWPMLRKRSGGSRQMSRR